MHTQKQNIPNANQGAEHTVVWLRHRHSSLILKCWQSYQTYQTWVKSHVPFARCTILQDPVILRLRAMQMCLAFYFQLSWQ